MRLKTVVEETFEDAKIYKSHCREAGTEKYQNVELRLAEMEYDDVFLEALAHKAAEYHIHTIFTFDYESSSDSGDGRDECCKEENDVPILLSECIIKDNRLYGVMCECFDTQGFVVLDHPETVLFHPRNYWGRNYHSYREKRFSLIDLVLPST